MQVLKAVSLCGLALALSFNAAAQTPTAPPPAAAPAPAAPPAPPAPPVGPIHAVSYIEASPESAAKAAGALRAYRAATAKEAGAVRVEIYQETTRPNRFVVDEDWREIAAYEAHAKISKLAETLQAGHLAPPDIRVHATWWTPPAPKGNAAAAYYGFTHIDVSPPRLAELEAMLKPFVEKSHLQAGAMRFDILQGAAPKRNHLTLAEAWSSEAAFRAHQNSAAAVEFRDRLGPILGALYDQRLYKLLK